MSTKQVGPARPTGKVRWRRFAAVAVPAVITAGIVVELTAQGALAASFAVAGDQAKVSASKLVGHGFVQFGTVDTTTAGDHHPVLVSGFTTATLNDLCQSVLVSTPFGKVTMKLTAGGGTTPVQATDLVVDLDQLSGNIEFGNYESGVDASKLSRGPVTGAQGGFGQQAETITITGLKQQAWATTAGTFTLKGLSLSTAFGTDECF